MKKLLYLFMFNVCLSDKLAVVNKELIIDAKFQAVLSDNGEFLFDKNMILPYVFIKELTENEVELEKITALAVDSFPKSISFTKAAVSFKEIDMSFWNNKFPNDKNEMISFEKKFQKFIKRKTKEEVSFHKFLFFTKLVEHYAHLNKIEEFDILLYNYCYATDPYLSTFLTIVEVQDKLINYKPLALGKFFDLDYLQDIRIQYSNSIDVPRVPMLDQEYEMDFLVKSFEYTLEDHLDKEEDDHSILRTIFFYIDKNFNLFYKSIKKSKYLGDIIHYIDIVRNKDLKQAIQFINNPNLTKHLRRSMIIDLISTDNANQDLLKKSVIEKFGITQFMFQFIPQDRWAKTIVKMMNYVEKGSFKNYHEVLNSLTKMYGDEMGLSEVNKSNLVFQYLVNHRVFKESIDKLSSNKPRSQLATNELSKVVEVSRMKFLEARAIEDEFVSQMYMDTLSLLCFDEINKMFFSSIIESKVGLDLFRKHFETYQMAKHFSLDLNHTIYQVESLVLEMIYYIANNQDEVGLEVVARNTSAIANKFPGKLEVVYPYINRAIAVIFKDNSELIKKLQKIKDDLKG